MLRILREPLVHFVALGALIFAAYSALGPAAEDPALEARSVRVSAGELEWIENSWRLRWNRPPTEAERRGLVDAYVRETILYREALAMGLDRDDPIVRRRLAQKLEFLSDDLLEPEAPDEAQLRTWFEERRADYRPPVLVTFSHAFVDPELHGDDTQRDAEVLLAELRAKGPPDPDADPPGDPFMLQAYYPERSELDVTRLFGGGFAESLARLEPGRWQGPVLSGYGAHLVWVHARSEPEPVVFEAVRERVEADWRDERRRELNEQFYTSLRARYDVVVEDLAEAGPGPGQGE